MSQSSHDKKHRWPLRIALVVVITLVLGLSLVWRADIDRALRLVQLEESEYTGEHKAKDLVVAGSGGDLLVHFIDVDQGDACIVVLPDGRTVLIDAGPGKNKEQLLTYIDDNFVKGKSADKKLTKFDFAVLTHSDEDHCGGFPDVLKTYKVGTFYRPNELSTRAPFVDPGASSIVGTGKKDTAVYQKTVEAAYGDAVGEVIITYAPELDKNGLDRITPTDKGKGDDGWYELIFFGPYGHSYKDTNDNSPIIIVEYNGKRIALSGDAEKKAEEEFVANATDKTMSKFIRFTADYTAAVIKLGHHGSGTSSGESYLNTLTNSSSKPGVLIVISVGLGNTYGHPHPEVLTRLDKLGFDKEKILRTDELSHIVVTVRGSDGALLFGGTGYIVEAPAVHELLSWLTIALAIWLILTSAILILPMVATRWRD